MLGCIPVGWSLGLSMSFCHNRNSNYELIWAINMEILHNYIKFDIMNLANLGGYYGIHCLGYHLQLYTE